MERLVERLGNQFPGRPAEAVRAIVHACYDEFKGHPIRDFVPVLVERSAKTRLATETHQLDA